MENKQEMTNQTAETSRRKFLAESAKKAAWAAPALTLMMAASSTPARAAHKYGNSQIQQFSIAEKPKTGYKKPKSGYKFWKMWHQVHRGRQM